MANGGYSPSVNRKQCESPVFCFFMTTHNFAFIDEHNMFRSIERLGWKMDYKKFRVYLKDKYCIDTAYMFLGYTTANNALYNFLRSAGFVLIFKPVYGSSNNVKGNCDAELILQAMIDFDNYHEALIITGDSDFYCLVKYLMVRSKLLKVLAPARADCSFLYKRLDSGKISFIADLREKLEYKKRTP